MSRRRGIVIDLCSGGGGASVGYWLAGWDVVGVDIRPQPHYPFAFVQADVMGIEIAELVGSVIAARAGSVTPVLLHASFPCQRWSRMTPAERRHQHPDLITPGRRRLSSAVGAGVASAWIMENVEGAPMSGAVTICGGGLGLGVRRHRLFESSLPLCGVPCAHGGQRVPSVVGGYGGPARGRYVSADEGREAMGAPWLPWPELVQSIPPAYTEHLGRQAAELLGVDGVPSRLIDQLAPRCRCGRRLERAATGRWPKHCRQACRQAAYMERRRGSVSDRDSSLLAAPAGFVTEVLGVPSATA